MVTPTKTYSIEDFCVLNGWKSRATYYNHKRRGMAPEPDFYVGPLARFTEETVNEYQRQAVNGNFARYRQLVA
jgi:hypothetical protein